MSVRGQTMGRARIRISARAMILTILVTALLVTAVFPIRTYLSERNQIHSLQDRISQLDAENQRLAHKIRLLHNPQFLERLARECLGMVKPDEVAFVVVPKHGSPKPESC